MTKSHRGAKRLPNILFGVGILFTPCQFSALIKIPQHLREFLALNGLILGSATGDSVGHVGRVDDEFVTGEEGLPLELIEPLVAFEGGEGAGVALLWGVVEQLLDKLLSFFIMNKLWELEILLHDLLINLIGPLRRIAKRQGPTQELIQADAQRP